MEVILTKDVEKIGKAGTVMKVKDGFARNFLLPGGFALPVTAGNIKKLEAEKQKKSEQAEKVKNEALALKERLAALSLTIPAMTSPKVCTQLIKRLIFESVFTSQSLKLLR